MLPSDILALDNDKSFAFDDTSNVVQGLLPPEEITRLKNNIIAVFFNLSPIVLSSKFHY